MVWGRPARGQAWAFVDVETTGLNPAWERIVSVSVLAFDSDGRPAGELHTLVNPGRSMGASHIHGITPEMVADAPPFHRVAPDLAELTHGRVMVAHNAQFDYGFLHAEATRAATRLPTTERLCTLALSRRLDLPVNRHDLATLARYWNVEQISAHDARDDVRVMREIFLHSERLARRLGVDLPVVACHGRGAVVYPATVPRVPSPYRNPRSWEPPQPLIQGTKVVITGDTTRPRLELAELMAQRGLDVMNGVSGQTRLLLCNDPGSGTVKWQKAVEYGIPILSESDVLPLLDAVVPGVLRSQPQPAKATSADATRPSRGATASAKAGPWTGRTVLVVGGPPGSAATLREELGALGARVLVNLGARTTHVVVLPGAETDPRVVKARDRSIAIVNAGDLAAGDSEPAAPQRLQTLVLTSGHVIDLEPDLHRVSVTARWQPPTVHQGIVATGDATVAGDNEVDVVGLLLDHSTRVRTDDDLVFYNQAATADGNLKLTVDGDGEQGVEIDLESIEDGVARIRVAAAIDGDATFGSIGAVNLALWDAETGNAVAEATLDAATSERTLILCDLYRRGSGWRFRAVGQGYDHTLAPFLSDHGVAVG